MLARHRHLGSGNSADQPDTSHSFNAGLMIRTPVEGTSNKFRFNSNPKKCVLKWKKTTGTSIEFKNRKTDIVEFSRVYSSKVSCRRIKTPDAKDRVYELSTDDGSEPVYFWMQTNSPSEDETQVKKLVSAINGEGSSAMSGRDLNVNSIDFSSFSSIVVPSAAPPAPTVDVQTLPESAFVTPAPATNAPAPADRPEQPNDLNALDGMIDDPELLEAIRLSMMEDSTNNTEQTDDKPNEGPSPVTQAAPSASPVMMPSASVAHALQNLLHGKPFNFSPSSMRARATPLNAVLDANELVKIVSEDSDFAKELMQYLPEGEQNLSSLIEILRSSQFQHANRVLTKAIESDVDAVLAGVGLNRPNMPPFDGTAVLVRAYNEKYNQDKSTSATDKEEHSDMKDHDSEPEEEENKK